MINELMGEKALVVDLDGTLCNCAHRVSYAQAGDWDAFHERLIDDQPHHDVLSIVEALCGTFAMEPPRLIICSGRNERYRMETMRWLGMHNIYPDAVLLRPNNDYTPDQELKIRMLSDHFLSLENARDAIICILEDRDKVVEALRNAGFPVWQVRPNSY